ncbi:MAG: DUF945 family protein [Pseudomonadales bacterium]|nr:DUF945 family protein [Pseudomonadales bacterium]
MKKAVAGLLILVTLLVVGWVASAFYIGRQIEAALADYEILFTRSGGLAVHQLDYEPGLFNGQLDYDLEIQPGTDSEAIAFVNALQQELGVSLRFSGTAQVSHGPLVGGSQPIALARMELPYRLPEALRDSLPQLPADAPLFTISSVLRFDGSLHNHLAGMDYTGDLSIDNDSAELTLSGLTVDVDIDPQLSSTHILFAVDTLRLAPEGVDMAIENLLLDLGIDDGTATALRVDTAMRRFLVNSELTATRLEVENLDGHSVMTRERPSIWLGGGEGTLERIALEVYGVSGELRDLSGSSQASIDDNGRYQASSESLVARITAGNNVVNDFAVDFSLNNINLDAYSDLMLLTTSTDPSQADPDFILQSVLDGINRLLADQPVLSLDRLSLSVLEPNDISLSTSVTYTGPALEDLLQPQEMLAGLDIQGEVYLAVPAVRELLAAGLAMADPSLQGSALDDAVDANYQQVVASLQDTGFVTITDSAITTSLLIRNGSVTLNGTELATVDDLMAMISPPDVGGQQDPGAVVMQPDFLGDPRFERVTLATGFTPDPHTVELLAGGQRTAMDLLGANCAGNVNSAQPDVTLSYSAGPDYGLYLYAESDVDATLVILTPQGWACDDDSHGDFNPGVSIDDPVTGDYMIWVGTYDGGAAQAVLGISEY